MPFTDTGVHDATRLKELQALPLERKIAITQARIIEWYNAYEGNVYVSLSGGKDSTVLLHLVRQLFPNVPAVFSNTGLEYPEIQKFAKGFDNVTTVTPKMNFVNVIRNYGYPLISKEVANAIWYARKIRPYDASSADGGGKTTIRKQKELLGSRIDPTGRKIDPVGGQRESMEETRTAWNQTTRQEQKGILYSPPREQLNTREQLGTRQDRIKKQTQREFSEGSTSWDSG